MSQTATNGFTRTWPDPADPFFYGWRDVYVAQPDGTEKLQKIPLTEWDVLHPQEGDHVMNGPVHAADCAYLHGVFNSRLADDPTAAAFCDVGVYWDDTALGHHSPDITVVLGVPGVRDLTDMYFVAKHGGVKPALLVEVVSPSTRKIDLKDKYDEYHQAGVPLYVIVDRPRLSGPPKLIGYRYAPDGWADLPLDDRGRLWLDPVRLWLGTTDNRVVCYDEAGTELGDYAAVTRALAAAEARADAEARRAKVEARRAKAEARRADTEARRADAEAQARQALEARVRELEEQLRRGNG